MKRPRLSRRGITLIGLMIVASISTYLVYSYANQELTLHFTDASGKPVSNSLVTIYADLPGAPSTVIAQGKTDSNGLFKFRMNMRDFTRKWIEHERSIGAKYGFRVAEVGLVYHIINPNEGYAWTGIIEIPIHNPPIFSERYEARVGGVALKDFNYSRGVKSTNGLELKDFCYRWRHETRVVDYYENHTRFVIARFNTSTHSKAIVDVVLLEGQIWQAKLWFGYSYSDNLQLSSGVKWSGEILNAVGVSASAGYSGVAAISIELTFHYEKIYHKIWDPQCGLIYEYYEYRIWHKDVDFNSLAAIDSEEIYYGDAYDKYYTSFTGQGVKSSDPYLYFSIVDVDVDNTGILNIGITQFIAARLAGSIKGSLLPDVGISVDCSKYLLVVDFHVWADSGYTVDIYMKYMRVNGIPFAVGYAADRVS